MNSNENLKSTQLRKLFKIFNSDEIFGAREGFLFDFASLRGVWKPVPACQRLVYGARSVGTKHRARWATASRGG
jgi:hypothetical protein